MNKPIPYRWHLIVNNKLHRVLYKDYVPRVGDELRFAKGNGFEFIEVTRIVWCLDEDEENREHYRVNIGGGIVGGDNPIRSNK